MSFNKMIDVLIDVDEEICFFNLDFVIIQDFWTSHPIDWIWKAIAITAASITCVIPYGAATAIRGCSIILIVRVSLFSSHNLENPSGSFTASYSLSWIIIIATAITIKWSTGCLSIVWWELANVFKLFLKLIKAYWSNQFETNSVQSPELSVFKAIQNTSTALSEVKVIFSVFPTKLSLWVLLILLSSCCTRSYFPQGWSAFQIT